MSGSSADSIDELFQQIEDFFAASWQALSAHTPNLHDLPLHAKEQWDDLLDKLTNNHTLPLPSLPSPWSPANAGPTPVPPSPPTPEPSAAAQLVNKLARHPYWSAAIGCTVTGATAYYLYPTYTVNLVKPLVAPLKPYVPLALLPKSNRPLRVLAKDAKSGGEIRKEAVVVLGAEGVAAELALDLEARGFVVIATVRNPSDVDVLEKRSRGWMKVLVLDPTESSSVQPFTRSLSTALSLRYPLHTSGDPFSRPSHSLALSAVINCLSLVPAPERPALCPLEGFESELIRTQIGERVSTIVGIIKAVLPLMRTSASRPGQPEGVFLSLFPTTSSNLSLPFHSLASAADNAIISLLYSLRRELSSTGSSNIRITILETGFFDQPGQTNASAASTAAQLPLRLSSLYAPALQRRSQMSRPNSSGSGAGTGGTTTLKALKRKASQPRRLHQKVFDIIVYSRGGTRSSVGSGSFTYRVLSFIPHSWLDTLLSMQDRLYSVYLSHRARLQGQGSHSARLSSSAAPSASAASDSPSASARGRGPLPTPPAPQHQQHPASLRPGHASTSTASQVPVNTFSSEASASASARGYASGNSNSGEDSSSVEDFGPLESSDEGEAEGMGSFVDVGRED